MVGADGRDDLGSGDAEAGVEEEMVGNERLVTPRDLRVLRGFVAGGTVLLDEMLGRCAVEIPAAQGGSFARTKGGVDPVALAWVLGAGGPDHEKRLEVRVDELNRLSGDPGLGGNQLAVRGTARATLEFERDGRGGEFDGLEIDQGAAGKNGERDAEGEFVGIDRGVSENRVVAIERFGDPREIWRWIDLLAAGEGALDLLEQIDVVRVVLEERDGVFEPDGKLGAVRPGPKPGRTAC